MDSNQIFVRQQQIMNISPILDNLRSVFTNTCLTDQLKFDVLKALGQFFFLYPIFVPVAYITWKALLSRTIL